MASYRDLIAWKRAMSLTTLVYRQSERFPRKELFGLTAQLRRAAVSIPSNIAEGQARHSKRDFQHFLRIAKGSLAEVETQTLLALELGFWPQATANEILQRCDELSRILSGLISSIAVEA
jgi:four helix bundle protein